LRNFFMRFPHALAAALPLTRELPFFEVRLREDEVVARALRLLLVAPFEALLRRRDRIPRAIERTAPNPDLMICCAAGLC
jgi:hypothetical protein